MKVCGKEEQQQQQQHSNEKKSSKLSSSQQQEQQNVINQGRVYMADEHPYTTPEQLDRWKVLY
jgi:hypothetical protein